jgi:hypothetical protein
MQWIKSNSPKEIKDLPDGTILKVEDEQGNLYIKVVGTGFILNHNCNYRISGWKYFEADWSSLGESFKVLEYAFPPDEYQKFLEEEDNKLG